MTDDVGTTGVLIVGGGPFGLMLSIELGRRGVPSLLIDAKQRTAVNPQANATQARTMEHYRRLGFAEEIRSLGLPRDYPTDIAYFTRYGATELGRFQLPSSEQAMQMIRGLGGSWSAAELPHRVSQKYVEQVLRRQAEASPLASVHYGWRLTAFEEIGSKVHATIEHVEDGSQREVAASYLIGADGARGMVRRQLGIRYQGETGVQRDFFGGRMVALYLRAPDFYRMIPHPRAWMYWAFNSERRSWLAAVNGRDEFAFHTQLKPGEDETIDADRARALFHQATGVPVEIELIDIDTWIAGHALVAERFAAGRVFLGGDAAHLFTPAGGLGYNTAVEDAVNLGWKLAAEIKGMAGPALLESYEYERRKLAVRNTGYARTFAESIGNFVPAPTLEAEGPEGDAARAAAGEYLAGHARREFNIPGVTFGGRYDGSPVIVADGTEPPEDAANVYVPSATPGGRAPHLWLEDGLSLYDLFGFEWSLLVLGDRQAEVAAIVDAASRRGMDLTVVRLPMAEARALYESDLVLIRPDQIVAWRYGGAHDPDAVLDQVLGHEVRVSERISA